MPDNFQNSESHCKGLPKTSNVLSSSDIIVPDDLPLKLENPCSSKGYFDYIHYNPNSTQDMYGKDDLAKFPMFSGGYINFGFWKGINYKNDPLTEEKRTQSAINLYQYAFEQLGLNKNSEVLEVGSGQGNGCVILSKQFRPKRIVGLDAVSQQTERAKHRHTDFIKFHPEVEFFTGLAEKIPFQDNSFSHLISIEAASHFSSMTDFFYEASRVLKPDGKLLVATVFPKDTKTLEELQGLLPKYHVYMNDFTIDKVQKYATNFQNIKITSIGNYVWEGLDEWLKRDELKQSWSRLWLQAYKTGLIDYYVIEASTFSLEEKFKNQPIEPLKMGQIR